jgi:CBS domain-containing protein
VTVGEVMTKAVTAIPAATPVKQALREFFLRAGGERHQAYPVVDGEGHLLGVVTRGNLLEDWVAVALNRGDDGLPSEGIIAYDLIHREPITAYPWETCRTAAERMAAHGVGRLPVVSSDDPRKLVGMLSRSDLLKPRARRVEEEAQRERFFRFFFGGPGKQAAKK